MVSKQIIGDIGRGEFARRNDLESIELVGTDFIDKYAFLDCKSIKSIKVIGSIKRIQEWAFGDCSNLENIEIHGDADFIDKEAFVGCKSLKTLEILGNVNYIGEDAFLGCRSLEKIIISGDEINLAGKPAVSFVINQLLEKYR